MGYYKSPEDMFTARANRFKRDADRHWAIAKSGGEGYHYTKAKFCYEQAVINQAKAERAHATGATFRKCSATNH